MWRGRCAACIAVAWLAPLVWLAVLPWLSPSDGTVVSSPTAVLGEGRWGTSLRVLDTFGETPLRPGDQILSMDDREIAELVSVRNQAPVEPGDVVVYRVRRPDAQLDRIQLIEVRLTRHPVGSALADNPHYVVLVVGLLVAGSVLLLGGAERTPAVATLTAGAAAGMGLRGHPMGVAAVDVTGATGLATYAVGQVALALATGALIVAVVWFPRPPRLLAAGRGRVTALLALPFAGYVAWVLTYALQQSGPARLQAALDLVLPAAVVALMAFVTAGATGRVRARTAQDQLALRLLALAALTAAMVTLLLDTAPTILRGDPLVRWELLALVLVPMVLACWVAAVLGYRISELDATLRRSALQGAIAALVGIAFLSAANVLNVASGTSVGSMVAGAVLVLMLLPAALLLRRTVSRLVYGDRATPGRVVAQLRHLAPTTAPDEALQEMLAMLSRSLRLSYASIESAGDTASERLAAELGERRAEPTTVVLEVAGTPVGHLQMEVSPFREPFGARDRRLLEDLGTQVGALVQVLQGSRDLQRTRERLVAAREEERRRLRRDLHDGLGPSLASTLMSLEVARDLVHRDPGEASALIEQLTDQTESAIAEIRRLVEGLRPPALDQLGLVSALRQRADQHNHAVDLGSSGPRWSVDADDLRDLPAAVEVAAYRIVVESVNNAIRHGHASHCVVTLRRHPDGLRIEVRDDGTGLAADAGIGVGVGSMRDRAEELGGTCTLTTGPGGGTRVRAHLPLSDRAHEEGPAS